MASIGFTTENVHLLMSIIDEKKDEMSEMEYLQICNMMSTLYKISTHPQQQPQF